MPQQPVGLVSPTYPVERKSGGAAVLLSLLWPGAGHLYAGDNDKGLVFTIISAVCFVISLTIIGLIITIPVWLGCATYTMINVTSVVDRYNARLPAAAPPGLPR